MDILQFPNPRQRRQYAEVELRGGPRDGHRRKFRVWNDGKVRLPERLFYGHFEDVRGCEVYRLVATDDVYSHYEFERAERAY